MAKKESKKEQIIKEVKEAKENKDIKVKRKKKMTRAEKNRLIMKIAAWFMAIVMCAGVIMSLLSYFIGA